jgi:hypothetical protein
MEAGQADGCGLTTPSSRQRSRTVTLTGLVTYRHGGGARKIAVRLIPGRPAPEWGRRAGSRAARGPRRRPEPAIRRLARSGFAHLTDARAFPANPMHRVTRPTIAGGRGLYELATVSDRGCIDPERRAPWQSHDRHRGERGSPAHAGGYPRLPRSTPRPQDAHAPPPPACDSPGRMIAAYVKQFLPAARLFRPSGRRRASVSGTAT